MFGKAEQLMAMMPKGHVQVCLYIDLNLGLGLDIDIYIYI